MDKATAAKVCNKRAAALSTLNRVWCRSGGGGFVGAWEGMGGGGDQQSRLINILSQHTVHGDERHIHYIEQIIYENTRRGRSAYEFR